jgi:peptide deformylase
MMALQIAQLGQPVLRQMADEVPLDKIASAEFQAFLADMLATLRAAHGAGLAAPQVFVSQRVFLAAILPPSPEDPDGPPGVEVFINPIIQPLSAEQVRGWEGCLSFSELLVLVPRYRAVRIDYTNAEGKRVALELRDFPARVVQHEFDHLDGILTLDRAGSTHDIVKASEIDAVVKSRGGEV